MSEANRLRWRDFICAPDGPGRFLSSLGTAVRWGQARLISDTALGSFLGKVYGGNKDLGLLANVVDLLRPQYGSFLHDALPRLLDHLSNEVLRDDEIVGPHVRGHVQWGQTILGRMTGVLPATKYVSRTAYRSFNRPENQLLRWLISELRAAIQRVHRLMHASHPSLVSLLTHCEASELHHWLSEVIEPDRLTDDMIRAAMFHRRPEYREAATLAEHRRCLDEGAKTGKWLEQLMLLQCGWLEPVNTDDLFELYALVLVIDILQEELGFGEPTEYGLVAFGRRHVARFVKDTTVVDVFFDQSLVSAVDAESEYIGVVREHSGLSGSVRRPDIVIRHRQEDLIRDTLLAIEVKKTRDGGYISDSVYKAFGYLYDYRSVWQRAANKPKLILLVPEGVEFLGDLPGEVVVTSSENRRALATHMESGLRSCSSEERAGARVYR